MPEPDPTSPPDKLVRCSLHGAYYRASERACPQCLAGAPAASGSASRNPGRVLAIVVALGLVGGLGTVWWFARAGDRVVAAAAVDRPPLDPNRYREAIEKVEYELYRYPTGRPDHVNRLRIALAGLWNDIAMDEMESAGPWDRPRGVEVNEYLVDLPDEGAFDLAGARAWWESTRSTLFAPAPWFAAGQLAPEANPLMRLIRGVETAHAGVAQAIRSSRSVILAVSDTRAPTSTGEERRAAQWTSAATRLQRQVETALARMPADLPSTHDLQRGFARRDNPQALSALARAGESLTAATAPLLSMLRQTTVPSVATRERQLDDAARRLDTVADLLAEARQ